MSTAMQGRVVWKQHYNTPLGASTVNKYVFKV